MRALNVNRGNTFMPMIAFDNIDLLYPVKAHHRPTFKDFIVTPPFAGLYSPDRALVSPTRSDRPTAGIASAVPKPTDRNY